MFATERLDVRAVEEADIDGPARRLPLESRRAGGHRGVGRRGRATTTAGCSSATCGCPSSTRPGTRPASSCATAGPASACSTGSTQGPNDGLPWIGLVMVHAGHAAARATAARRLLGLLEHGRISGVDARPRRRARRGRRPTLGLLRPSGCVRSNAAPRRFAAGERLVVVLRARALRPGRPLGRPPGRPAEKSTNTIRRTRADASAAASAAAAPPARPGRPGSRRCRSRSPGTPPTRSRAPPPPRPSAGAPRRAARPRPRRRRATPGPTAWIT